MIPFANATVTIYNKVTTTTSGKRSITWQRHVISGCFWNGQRTITHQYDNSDNAGYHWLCKLPYNASYVTPAGWASADKTSRWTVQTDDVIVREPVTDTISSSFSINDLKEKYRGVGVMTVTSTADYSKFPMAHIRADGV